ncbi:hypothetical protein GGR51DRAFT_572737 [Nemania sp. FL0031]|nr:hypothetical protein GGR51DRAFT_572737 [Nemania sp. FL0031]
MALAVWVAMTLLLLITSARATSKDAGQFFSPPNAVTGTHDYSTNPVYHLGQKQTIKFTTIYQNYKIDLWQQRLHKNAASVGPAVFQTTGGAVTQFDWIVQAYQFDLSSSDMFFFWLTSTDNTKSQSFTSHYFNITQDDTPASSSSATLPPSIGLSSTASIPSTAATTSPSPTRNQASSGLSAGAQAGIGVGAALAGLAAILVAFAIYRRSRVKRNDQTPETKPSQTHGNEESPQGQDREYYKPQDVPVETANHRTLIYSQNPVELPAGNKGG